MKLVVGMYVRTDKGFITKVKEFQHHYTKGKRLVTDYSVKEVAENYLLLDGDQCSFIDSIDYSIPPCYPSDEELDEIKSHIVKTSYSIIDILEVGDYVNGVEVINIDDEWITMSDIQLPILKSIANGMIKSVITHEQMEKIAYKVVSKDE